MSASLRMAVLDRQRMHLSLYMVSWHLLLLYWPLHTKSRIIHGSQFRVRLAMLCNGCPFTVIVTCDSVHGDQRLSHRMCLFRRDPGEECSLFRGDGRPSVSLWLLLLLLAFRPVRIRVGVAIQDETSRWTSLHLLHLLHLVLSRVVLRSHFAMIAASLTLELMQYCPRSLLCAEPGTKA